MDKKREHKINKRADKKEDSVWKYFSKEEYILWGVSLTLIIGSFVIFDRVNYMTLAASVIGATAILFNAKGNPFGQLLMILFSVLYARISYSFAYYGEMITYMGMTAPMALFSLIAWLRNPYQGKRTEVAVNILSKKEIRWMWVATVIVTIVFYFILDVFHTANILPSTLSVTTSFLAAYLTFRRSPLFSLAYAANDVVLLALWVMATLVDISYLSVVVCFVAFLANDIYAYISWKRMHARQRYSA